MSTNFLRGETTDLTVYINKSEIIKAIYYPDKHLTYVTLSNGDTEVLKGDRTVALN